MPLAPPVGEDDRLLPVLHLEGEAAVGVQDEGRSVEHDLVLSAHPVQIDERQPGFRYARDGQREADVVLVDLERRSVGNDENLRAGFGQALCDVRKPHVLADRNTKSEEHTSELQSLMRISYAVFCLKQKKTNKLQQYTRYNHK